MEIFFTGNQAKTQKYPENVNWISGNSQSIFQDIVIKRNCINDVILGRNVSLILWLEELKFFIDWMQSIWAMLRGESTKKETSLYISLVEIFGDEMKDLFSGKTCGMCHDSIFGLRVDAEEVEIDGDTFHRLEKRFRNDYDDDLGHYRKRFCTYVATFKLLQENEDGVLLSTFSLISFQTFPLLFQKLDYLPMSHPLRKTLPLLRRYFDEVSGMQMGEFVDYQDCLLGTLFHQYFWGNCRAVMLFDHDNQSLKKSVMDSSIDLLCKISEIKNYPVINNSTMIGLFSKLHTELAQMKDRQSMIGQLELENKRIKELFQSLTKEYEKLRNSKNPTQKMEIAKRNKKQENSMIPQTNSHDDRNQGKETMENEIERLKQNLQIQENRIEQLQNNLKKQQSQNNNYIDNLRDQAKLIQILKKGIVEHSERVEKLQEMHADLQINDEYLNNAHEDHQEVISLLEKSLDSGDAGFLSTLSYFNDEYKSCLQRLYETYQNQKKMLIEDRDSLWGQLKSTRSKLVWLGDHFVNLKKQAQLAVDAIDDSSVRISITQEISKLELSFQNSIVKNRDLEISHQRLEHELDAAKRKIESEKEHLIQQVALYKRACDEITEKYYKLFKSLQNDSNQHKSIEAIQNSFNEEIKSLKSQGESNMKQLKETMEERYKTQQMLFQKERDDWNSNHDRELAERDAWLQQSETKVQDLSRSMDEMKNNYEKQIDELKHNCEKQIDELRNEDLHQMDEIKNTYEKQINEVKKTDGCQIDELTKQNGELTKQNGELTKQIDDVTNHYEQLKDDYENRIKEMEAEMEGLKQVSSVPEISGIEIEQLKESLTECTNQKEQCENEINELKETHTQEISKYTQQIADRDETIADLQESLNEKIKELQKQNEQSLQKDEKIQDLEESIQKKTQDIQSQLEKERQDWKYSHETDLENLQQTECKVTALMKSIQEQKNNYENELKQQTRKHESEIQEYRKEFDGKLQELTDQYQNEMQKQRTTFERQIQEIQINHQQEIKTKESHIQQRQDELANLKSQCANRMDEIHFRDQQIQQLNEELSRIKNDASVEKLTKTCKEDKKMIAHLEKHYRLLKRDHLELKRKKLLDFEKLQELSEDRKIKMIVDEFSKENQKLVEEAEKWKGRTVLARSFLEHHKDKISCMQILSLLE